MRRDSGTRGLSMCAVVAGLAFGAPAPVQGQVFNGTFAEDLGLFGWSFRASDDFQPDWSPDDADGAEGSGSARGVGSAPGSNRRVSQDLVLTADPGWTVAYDGKIPSTSGLGETGVEQNFAPSVCSIQIPRISSWREQRIPIAR